MTTHEKILAQLDDFADGQLEPRQAVEVKAHLQFCSACRLELESLRSLSASVRELPEEIEPSRDLWPEVEARLDEATADTPAKVINLPSSKPAASEGNSLLTLRSVTWLLAAVLAFALLLPPTLRGLHPQSSPVQSSSKDMLALCSQSMISDCRTVFTREDGDLPSATELTLNRSLDQIARALRETVAAMNKTDVNSPGYRSLAAGYRNKLDILQRIAAQTTAL
jgi:hypothetical protein